MRLLTFFIAILLIIIITGCSGGFDSDCSNSKKLEQSIFGPDTTVQ